MSLVGKDGHFVGTEIDSSLSENNDPFLFLLSATEDQSDNLEMEDNLFSPEQSDYLEMEDNVFSPFLNNSSSSSSSLQQDLTFMGFNFSLCLIPEVSLTGNQGECIFSLTKL